MDKRTLGKEQAKTFTDRVELLIKNPDIMMYELVNIDTDIPLMMLEGFTGYAIVTPRQYEAVLDASEDFKQYAINEEGITNPIEQAEYYTKTIAPIKHMLDI